MKRLLCFICLCIIGFAASAGDNMAVKVDRNIGPYTLLGLVPTDNTVLFYCTFTVQDTMELPVCFRFDHSVMVKSDDLGYNLVNTYNVPARDDGKDEYAFLDSYSQSLNFVLEFEKFPLDAPFDLIENASKTDAFNLTGVSVDETSVITIDPAQFLDSTPYTRFGTFVAEGNTCVYYSGEDFFISATACEVKEDVFSNYGSTFITVTNNSDHPFAFGLFRRIPQLLSMASTRGRKGMGRLNASISHARHSSMRTI